MSSGRIAQHRNYSQIMARHEKEVRIKKIMRIFMYFLIIAFIIILFVIIQRVSSKKDSADKVKTSLVIPDDLNLQVRT